MSEFRRKLMMAYAANLGRDNITYPGLIAAWSAKGKTNDDEDRAILKDLTGNGHDITLNGFAFSEMSGYGGYLYNLNTLFPRNPTFAEYKSSSNKFEILQFKEGNGYLKGRSIERSGIIEVPSFTVKITGIEGTIDYWYVNKNGKTNKFKVTNGEVTLPKSYKIDEVTEGFIGFVIGITTSDTKPITIELLPEYPDALVFDGVDDYGINENMPILTDYTIIVKRYRIEDKGCVIAKTGYPTSTDSNNWDFILEGGSDYASSTWSLSVSNKKNIISEDITFQTKNSYNGETISYLSSYKGKANCLTIGKLYPNDGRLLRGAFYSAYLFDRSLDEQEIKFFIRKHIDPEYLLPSEILTPDCYYDFSQGSNDDENRDTIKDYSGNGNDAVAHNFAWSGMSGYGGYVTNFYNTKENTITADIQNNKLNVTNITGNGKFAYTWVHAYPDIINNSYKIQVNGLKDTMNLVYRYYDKNRERERKEINIPKDGVYQIPSGYGVQGTETIDYSGFNVSNFTGECNLIIEMIPKYPGALVFDGVDDYISLDAFDSGFKTMFMVCKPLKMNEILYDQRTLNTKNDFALYLVSLDSMAYDSRNVNGTYINNKFDSYLVENTLNKKQLIMVKSKLTEKYKPIIGGNQSHNNFFANMALYKFLGFKEALTEEQIQAVIKKYNLLDGVDEIEVS